ncbi:MAG: ParA family protein [Bacteroidaceae bacterium]|nr:ParA family protein [Bacteroidaceae bacterium]
MQNKIIVCVGLKGGGGKSTVCANLALHLIDQGIPVIVYDADIQQTLVRHRQRELVENPDAELPYQLLPFSTADAESVKANMAKLKEVPAIVLFDCPGNIQDACLQHIYEVADMAVVPTRYDSDNLDATVLFADMFTKISKAKMFFVPNCINAIEERREEIKNARDIAYKMIGKYGFITSRIKQSVTVKCYSTIIPHDSYHRNAVKFAFEPIMEYICK